MKNASNVLDGYVSPKGLKFKFELSTLLFLIPVFKIEILLPGINSLFSIKKLRARAEASLNKTAEIQQVLAQLEADLSRKETQKVQQKSNKS